MNTELGAFVTLVIKLVIAAALPVLLPMAIAWGFKKLAQAKAHLTQSQLYLIQAGVRIFVEAAEQSGLWQAALDTGAKKKAWVVGQATDWCKAHGLPIDLVGLNAQIEAIVHEMNWDDPEPARAEVPLIEPTANIGNLRTNTAPR